MKLGLQVLVWVAVLFGAVAHAQSSLSFSAGQLGVTDDLREPQWYGVELRFAPVLRWAIVPGIGFHRAGCGANYVYADFRKPIWLSDRWALTPHFGPGLFTDSDQVNLGHDIQFRSGIELVYRTRKNLQVGVGITHLSNGSLSERNPGTETIGVSFSMPI
ncbi:MAG: acyloxyacyl hydrolase [Gammaproteobacteria bacterium]